MTSARPQKPVGPADINTPEVRGRLNAIAHDFNNLLTVVNGYADLLLKELPDGELREQLQEIRGAGAQAVELNDELLSIVRPPAADLVLSPHAPAAAPAAASDQPAPPAQIRRRVLVVDDEEAVRKFLVGVLANAGYEVVAASDGHEAQELLEARVDLVVMDLVMPNREGIETIAAFHRARPELKIIAISGHGDTFLNVATRLGACATFAKPIGPDQLLDAVRHALGGSGR